MNGDVFGLLQGLGHKLVVTVTGLMIAVVVVHLLTTFWKTRNVMAIVSVLVLGGAALWGMDNVEAIKNVIGSTVTGLSGR
jgi:hypothetical protein